MKSENEDKRIICPMCNIICIELIPLYDDDQKHIKQQCCYDCKKKIRNKQEIVKFKRDAEVINALEKELIQKRY